MMPMPGGGRTATPGVGIMARQRSTVGGREEAPAPSGLVRPSPKLLGYAVLGVLGLMVALILGRPEPVVLAIPFVVALVLGLGRAERPDISVDVRLSEERVIEGDHVELQVELVSSVPVGRLETVVTVPPHLVPLDGGLARRAVRLLPGVPNVATMELEATRWGTHRVGPLVLRTWGRSGLIRTEVVVDRRLDLRVHPTPESLRRLVSPSDTRALVGNRTARHKAEGIEFADIRPYIPGDRVREINWRATARRGDLWVNQRHPERNSDVVIFLDTFSDLALAAGTQAATALVTAYAGQRDRVGLVTFGGVLNWVQPNVGQRHLYRLLDTLLSSAVYPSYVWKDVGGVPTRALPPKALVWIVSPLEDDRVLAVIHELSGRGVDLAVIEVPLHEMYRPEEGEQGELAHRLWCLERAAQRARLSRLGVAVVEWHEGLPLAAVSEEVGAFRRRGRQRAG
ncbi:MAG: DUF58 domain-containing protein [Acidimicrobiales bacterium]|nr:DUF58 domain-containing protein [Acidimicrobiales bacterium]